MVSGNLSDARAFHLNDGVIVTGVYKTGTGTFFKAIKYGNDLKVLKEVTKTIADDAKVNCQLYGSVLLCFLGANSTPNYLQLTPDLENAYSGSPSSGSSGATSMYSYDIRRENAERIEGAMPQAAPLYKKGIRDLRFLDRDIIDFYAADKATGCDFSRNKAEASEYGNLYSVMWATHCESAHRIKFTGFLSISEKEIIACVADPKMAELGQDILVSLAPLTGKVNYSFPLVFPDIDMSFFMTNGFIDPDNDHIIVAGELYPEGKRRITEMAVLEYNKKGVLLKSKRMELKEIEGKKLSGFNTNKRTDIVRKTGKLSNGNYFMLVENLALNFSGLQYTAGGPVYERFSPVGYSYYELNSNLDVVFSNSFVGRDYNKMVMEYCGASDDGKYVFFTQSDKKDKAVNMFPVGKAGGATVAPNDYFNFYVYRGEEMKEADQFESFVSGDHYITFFQPRNSTQYNLQTYLIK